MTSRFQGKTAIVTGGASGIGRACALRFAEEGADVAIADLAGGSEVVREIEALGRNACFVETDVANEGSAEAMAEAAMKRFGRVDVLVAAAGISHAGYTPGSGMNRTADFAAGQLLAKPVADFEKVVSVNMTGVLLANRAAARRMIVGGRGGAIVNVT
ncbi:MAG: SDR family NAD(P)-dependent oxidoreductase, partial [Candidatus Binatia bacterium]